MNNEQDLIQCWLERDDLGFESSSSDDDTKANAQSPVSVSSSEPVVYRQKRSISRDAWNAQASDHRRRMDRRWHEQLPHMQPLSAEHIYLHKRFIRKGIPSRLRPQIWSTALSIPVLAARYPGEFQRLLSRTGQHGPTMTSLEQIEKDLQRTFPNHPFYRTESGISALRQTLTAFAVRNPHIGYSQSMNFVAGLLNLIFDPEKAFWMLVAIVERILPRDFYDLSLLGCRVEIGALRYLIQKMLPEVDNVLDKFNVDIVVVCVGWYLPLFVNTLPIETLLRVWDCFLVEGDKILFRISLALLKLHTSDLQACRDVNQVIRVLTRIGKDQFDADALIQTAFHRIGTLKRSSIAKHRSRCREKEEEIERKHSERRRTQMLTH